MLPASLGTFAGYYLVGALPVPLAAGLLCLTPIFFLASLAAGIRHRRRCHRDRRSGLCLAPLFDRLIGGGFDLIISGVIAGSIAFACAPAMRQAKP